MAKFDVVVDPARSGSASPSSASTCALSCCRRPAECVFLDDLGINLKPARDMGMTTIKVGDPAEAIGELEAVLGLRLT